MKQYIVDAFTDQPFSGNPAAVCVMDYWPSDQALLSLAAENNLSETAFLVKEEKGYHLRWFTPETEVELCGHATLASAYVILNHIEKDWTELVFQSLSGPLEVKRHGELYQMTFPSYDLQEIPVTDEMEAAFGYRPSKAVLGLDLICIFDSEELVRKMTPNQELLAKLPGRIQNASALGQQTDTVSRSFAPKLGIPEDPVCGSAHCQIADYWASHLGKNHLLAYQASKRGGYLDCKVQEDKTIQLSGKACLVAISQLMVEL
ncbi:PhzF family phenazine biosynthesis protein [Streptococcus loxodontisalivarius]|uniref:PhzF family phenazine biosynthesis protein n=1 Tax=Streptococcus loxodontisalivarius TaxID=1349415 RepID=A0ABS2PRP0_9STRE|nr:PhzF family phenazine biosynthesis protein [Streptococcus loxodontisalivarius]MBM7642687.1 PhzF family phenazine biosynthesis protein [Streptococcus loxodontisalivarius]